ncbi:hypothetical protein ALC62_12233 [Cyphomyrmex costatus]|uniref:Uncharacterized protein n=1 Tax=Cyphomyrmex costatus TaxID=456900 RepID=A0A195C8V1_9HYME|nr:hypothetical protein ALC62_12233 [Cyphomyrmex costatus]
MYMTYSLTPNPNSADDHRSFDHQVEPFFGSLNAKNRVWTHVGLNSGLQIASQSHRARQWKREREREKETGTRRDESKEPTEPVYREELSEEGCLVLLRVYGRRVSVVRVRVSPGVLGPPRARQPRRTFVRVEAERGLQGVRRERRRWEEGEASRSGFPFSYRPTFSSSTYLVNSVTIRHFLFLAK